MSYPVTKDPIPLPMPLSGFNARDPLESMDPSFSPWLLNMEPEPRFLKVRGAWEKFATISSGAGDYILALGQYNNSELYSFAYDASNNFRITDISAGGSFTAADHSTVTSTTSVASYKNAMRRLWFISETAGAGAYYNGSTWNTIGFTYSAATFPITALCGYKGRMYMFYQQYMYYGALDAITGAVTRIDLQYILGKPGNIIWCEVFATPSNKETETTLAFGTDSGEIFVYAGDYPAAANWEQIAHFETGTCLGSGRSVMQFKNDIWITTSIGVVSLKKLFNSGSRGEFDDQDETTVSGAINSYFIDLVNRPAIAGTQTKGHGIICHKANTSKVYLFAQGQIARDGTYTFDSANNTIFVYNDVSKAWIPHFIALNTDLNAWDMIYFKGDMYLSAGSYVYKYNPDGYVDIDGDSSEVTYDYAMHSAYTNLGSPNKYKTVRTVEPIIKTDFTGSAVGVKVDADFDKATSAQTSNALLDGRQSPVYTVGEKGAFLQYRIEGTADANSSDGLEIYSVGMSLK